MRAFFTSIFIQLLKAYRRRDSKCDYLIIRIFLAESTTSRLMSVPPPVTGINFLQGMITFGWKKEKKIPTFSSPNCKLSCEIPQFRNDCPKKHQAAFQLHHLCSLICIALIYRTHSCEVAAPKDTVCIPACS